MSRSKLEQGNRFLGRQEHRLIAADLVMTIEEIGVTGREVGGVLSCNIGK